MSTKSHGHSEASVAREYSRTQRVGDFLQQELAQLIQRELA